MLIKFTYIDAITGVSMLDAPCANGPALPNLPGISISFADESRWPCGAPVFHGFCDDGGDPTVDGVIDVVTQEVFDSSRVAEIEARRKAKVPKSVSMRQAELALLAAGLLDNIEALVATLPRTAQIEWRRAKDVERTHGLIAVVQAQTGMTDEQVDNLFIEAGKL